MNPTEPFPADYPNRPWSLPPCPNAGPHGEACTLHAHLVERGGVREHGAHIKVSVLYLPLGAKRRKRATYHQWLAWYTQDPET